MGTPFFVLSGGQRPGERGSRPWPGAPGHVPPAPPACGPTPCPPWADGGAAARPVQPPAGSGRGNVAAKPAQALAGQVGRQPLHGGTPPQCKAKPLRGGPMARPCIAPPPCRLRRRCSGAARPPLCGGCGAVRPSGPVGGASASRASPATPAAQAVPPGSAFALAARRSGPGPLAGGAAPQPSRGPGCGLLCSPCPCGGPQFIRRPLGPRKRGLCPLCGRLGRWERRLRAGVPPGSPAGKAKASPAQGGRSRPQAGALPASEPGSKGKRGGCPALWRVSRPLFILGF